MRQKDIIKALQNVSEKDAVQLGEEYHGIADIDHERLLRKVEQRLEMRKEVQDSPEIPGVPVPAASVSREPRFPWLTVGMTIACCMVGILGISMIWNIQRIAPIDQPTETMTEATTTYYHVEEPFITETATTEKTEQVTTICTTVAATSTETTTAAASSFSLQAVPHSTAVTTSAAIQTQTESQNTTQQTAATLQSMVTVYVPQTDAPAPVIETGRPASTATVTTFAPLTEPVSGN